MFYVICGKVKNPRGGMSTKYYKHYDGKRPILGSKSEAAKLDDEQSAIVLRQLHTLGFVGLSIVKLGS